MSTKKNKSRANQAASVDLICQSLPLPLPLVIPVKPISAKDQKDQAHGKEHSISFILSSTTQAAHQHTGHTTGVLIFGSATRPGGGWRNGAIAQEEDVALTSSWGFQAEKSPPGFYKENKGWGADAILNARGLWLFDEYNYPLEKPNPCSFISIACPNRLVDFVKKSSYDNLIDKLIPRIVTALNTWESQNIDHIILGAIGCGVFKWDPVQSAKAFEKAIPLSKYKGHITFAFIDPNFKSIFEKQLSPLQTSPAKPSKKFKS